MSFDRWVHFLRIVALIFIALLFVRMHVAVQRALRRAMPRQGS